MKKNIKESETFKKSMLLYSISTTLIIIILLFFNNIISASNQECYGEICWSSTTLFIAFFNLSLIFIWEICYIIKISKKYLNSYNIFKLLAYILITSIFLTSIIIPFLKDLALYLFSITFFISSLLIIFLAKKEIERKNEILNGIIIILLIILLLHFIFTYLNIY